MPPKKQLDDQITIPITSTVKIALGRLAASQDRKTADLVRIVLGAYVDRPENQLILANLAAAEHNRPVAVPVDNPEG